MALSGSITTNNYDGRYYRLNWTAEQSIADNTSTISWTLSCAGGDDSWYAERTVKAVINGTTVYSKSARVERKAGTIASGTMNPIQHNADGSKSISMSLQVACYTVAVNLTKSGTFTLDTIPRGAKITAAPNFNDEDNPTITYSNPAGNAATTLQACISLDGSAADIAYRNISKTGSSYTFNLTTAERNILRNAAKNANSIRVYFYIWTTIGDFSSRNRIAKTLTIVNANPTISPTVKDTNAATIALTGDDNKFIKYYSNATYTINAAAKKAATISKYSVVCGNKSSTAASGTINAVESGSFSFVATDSRGNKAAQTINKTLISYVKLTCNMSVAAPTTDGNLTLTASGNYFNGSFGAVANALTVQYRYKVDGGSYSSWMNATAALNGNKYTATVNITGLDYRSSYGFQCRAIDKLATVNSAEKTVKTTPVFDWSSEDVSFNVPVDFKAGLTIANKVLWSGSYYMTAGQTANLNDAVSNQTSGIILVFSRYDIANSEALNEHFSFHYVPKIMIQLHNDKGCVFNMTTSNQSYTASKYLYISDTAIRGHDNNGTYGTGDTGVNYNNNRFVLRYVIGV